MAIGTMGAVVEGGQTWAHRIRMFRQVLKIGLGVGLLATLLLFLGFMYREPMTLHQSVWYYVKSECVGLLFDKIEVSGDYWAVVAHQRHFSPTIEVSATALSKASYPLALTWWECATAHVFSSLQYGVLLTCASFVFFAIRGRESKRKQHLSGKQIVPWWRVALKLYLSGKASPIKIGRLPLVKNTETQHILVSGGTGSGKTNCFHTLLPQIRKSKQRAVIVDLTGDFVNRYYRPDKDILLNPFDKRSRKWLPWNECHNSFDYDSIAESFIPSTHCEREGYWRTAAQSVLSATLSKTKDAAKIRYLIEILLYDSLSELCEFVQGTKAGAHLDLSSEKTAGSIRSVASTYIQSLETLTDTDDPFSIRDWVTNGDDDSWLFLSTSLAQRSTLRPMVSAWLSIAIRSLLQMQPDFDRRLWFVIDELPALQKVKDLETFVSESRKFGGCGLFAIQSPAQLNMIYGRDASKIILGNCLTKVVFYEQDPEIAAQLSKSFGEREVREYQEGISYGSHQMRDGVSLSSQTRFLPIVTSSEIQSLAVGTAMIKLSGHLPAVKHKF